MPYSECPNCGVKTIEGSKFCGKCGVALRNSILNRHEEPAASQEDDLPDSIDKGKHLDPSDQREPQPSPLGKRFGATLIDGFLFLVGIPLMCGLGEELGHASETLLGQYIFIPLPIGMLLYKPISTLLVGATPGKAVFRLYIGTDSGLDPVFVRASRTKAFTRDVLSVIFAVLPIVNLVWLVMMLVDSRKRGWHDKLAGTLVLRK